MVTHCSQALGCLRELWGSSSLSGCETRPEDTGHSCWKLASHTARETCLTGKRQGCADEAGLRPVILLDICFMNQWISVLA